MFLPIKKIIEDIKIPIMHIIRNSIDHGIEKPDERKGLEKTELEALKFRLFKRKQNYYQCKR